MRVLVFGDSILHATTLPEGSWVEYLRRNFEKDIEQGNSRIHTPELYNLGISGDDSEGILRRLNTEVKARKWEDDELAIVIAIGVNDSRLKGDQEFMTPEKYRSNIQGMLNKSRNYTDRILLIGLTAVDETRTNPVSWSNTSYSNERIRLFDKQLQGLAKENDLPYVGIHEFFLDKPNLVYDGAHPTAEGQKIIAGLAESAIEKLVA